VKSSLIDFGRFATTREYDASIIKEVHRYEEMLADFGVTYEGAVVLDLGAHKGFFTRRALDMGAAKVVAVEPSSENLRTLRKNGRGATIIHGVCCGWGGGSVMLTKSARMRSDAAYSVARASSGRVDVERVPVYSFSELVQAHGVQLVKMDFQGSEWGVFSQPIPDSVRVMFGELHYSGAFQVTPDGATLHPLRQRARAVQVLGGLRAAGFKLHFRRARQWRRGLPPQGAKTWFEDVVFLR